MASASTIKPVSAGPERHLEKGLLTREPSVKNCVIEITSNQNTMDLHLAAEQGDLAAVKRILAGIDSQIIEMVGNEDFDTEEAMSRAAMVSAENKCGETALYIAAGSGHLDVVKELLKCSDRECLTKKNHRGLDAFHVAAHGGHYAVVQLLLEQEPALSMSTKNDGQTALHMAVKGRNCEVVKLLIEKNAALLKLPDSKGNTALHTATRKKQYEMVKELLMHPDANVNALNRDHKTALDLTEEIPDSEKIRDLLLRYGAVHSKVLNRKLLGHGINTTSANKAAILIAQIAFAAIFTIPGGNDRGGIPLFMRDMPIKILVIFNSVAFFSSLAVIVIQINTSKGEQEAEEIAAVAHITAILIWLASASVSVVFMTAIYLVVDRHFEEVTILITVTGGIILIGSVCIRAYYEMKLRSIKSIRKKED